MHKLALWTGGFLLLLAAVLFASSDDTGPSEWSSQRLRVQQTLTGSAPCVTCHTAVSETPRLAIETGRANAATYTAHQTISPIDSPFDIEPNTKIVNAHARVEKIAVGARLLAVPPRDLANYEAAVDAFIAASEAIDRADTPAEHGEALRALDAVERRVLALEQHANPYRLVSAPDLPVPVTDSSASAPSAPSPLIALLVALVIVAPSFVALNRCETSMSIRPQRNAYSTWRRGPPAEVFCCVLSVGRGRLFRCMAQSLFSFLSFGSLIPVKQI